MRPMLKNWEQKRANIMRILGGFNGGWVKIRRLGTEYDGVGAGWSGKGVPEMRHVVLDWE